MEPSQPEPPAPSADPVLVPPGPDFGASHPITEPVGAVHDDTAVTPVVPAAPPPPPSWSAPDAVPADLADSSSWSGSSTSSTSSARPLTAEPVAIELPADRLPIVARPPAPPVPPTPTSPRKAALFGAVAGGLVAALVATGISVAMDEGGTTKVASTPVVTPVTAKGGSLDITAILSKVQPSVVAIETSESTSGGMFSGAGSGIVLTADGLVLTNAHVVSGIGDITVVLADGTQHKASLVGSSPSDDMAVVKVDGVKDLVPAELGSSAALQVGEEVIAIGNALNLGGPPTVTRGIVSAKDRDLSAQGISLQGLIQTDAAINPGNSGGPLVNSAGQVVGMNTAIVADAQNLGFSIAIDRAKPIVKELESGKGAVTPDQAFLGVSTTDVATLTDAQKTRFDVKVDKGALVTDVVPGSAADDGGLEVGDVITKVDGKSISAAPDVRESIISHEPGDKAKVEVDRAGTGRTLEVTLGRRGDGT